MEFWIATEEMKKRINEDKRRLLAYSDLEASSLSVPDQYQRMRYKREIESMEWLEAERRKMPRPEPSNKPISNKYRKKSSFNSWEN